MKRRLAIVLVLACGCLAAQETDPDATESIRVDVNVVNVPVTVASSEGKFIIDLNKDDFKVFEDGPARRKSAISRGARTPKTCLRSTPAF